MSTLITLTTDFGLQDHYVGVMKGVIAGIAPQARVIDLCHAVPPQDIARGAYILAASCRYFPAGTVHVAVVDPGVGSARRAIAVEAAGWRWVAPDNGLLGWVFEALHEAGLALGAPQGDLWHLGGGARAVVLEAREYQLPDRSQTFHGRDVFAPVAAHLASGVPLERLGPLTPAIARLPRPVPERTPTGWRGAVLHADRFGNLVTNLRAAHCPGGACRVRVAGREIEGLSPSYTAMTALGAIVGSDGYLEIAVPHGNAAALLGAGPGTLVEVEPLASADPSPEPLGG
ncbi:MAG: SAM-dependent chlorinase/fluorinase [Chloroflexi bacterium]|nr:SAM-dependent chlorinase/fluorinase [Chloroflexota bacterium]